MKWLQKMKQERGIFMIDTLHIRNIGIIDDLTVNLTKGFNVLTGETGAGKTLIIDSLQLLAGGRFSKEMLRTGEDYCLVEANLYLPKKEKEDYVLVTREVHQNGKNICKIDGKMVTVNELKEFMRNIINIHGQHDNQTILDKTQHIQYVDRFAGKQMKNLQTNYQTLYEKRRQIQKELQENYGDEKEKQRRLDLLQYQANEIQMADLKPGEEEELQAQRNLILGQEQILESLNQADYEINEISQDSLGKAVHSLEKIENYQPMYQNCLAQLKEAYYLIEEVGRDVAGFKEDTDFNEMDRQTIETRLDDIFSLKRKYGDSIPEILVYLENVQKEIDNIHHREEHNEQLRKELEKIEIEMLKISQEMHQIRLQVAQKLDTAITEQLQDLEMKNAKFKVAIQYEENGQYDANGLDRIEFLIATNKGDTYKELTKIASGGEMSRIMLGIKNVLSNVDEVPILVFDEIDTGISGVAANKVAEKLYQIAHKHQVLCITHLASIAAKGQSNYFVSKKVVNDKTITQIKHLTEEEVVKEIARIASGEITEISLKHAKELRNR